MKADLRISIKDYRINGNLKILLFRPPLAVRQYYVWMNPDPPGQAAAAWPKDRRAVSLALERRFPNRLRVSTLVIRGLSWPELALSRFGNRRSAERRGQLLTGVRKALLRAS